MRWWTSSARLACCKPEVSILSDAFLAEVRDLPQRNVALELFRTLLDDEIAVPVILHEREMAPGVGVFGDEIEAATTPKSCVINIGLRD